MKYFWWIYIIVISLLQARALIKFIQLPKGPVNGCISSLTGIDMRVGQYERMSDVCGVLVCESKEGWASILMCQKIHPFVHCNSEAVSTKMLYPKCCYICANAVDC